MKQFLNTKVNAAQLKLIVGDAVKHTWPTKEVVTKVGKVALRKQPDSIKNIISETSGQNLKSFDARFDNEHPIEVALKRISTTGLPKTTIAAIRNNKACQKKIEILGKWKVLNNFISEDHKAQIIHLLTETHDANVLKFGERYYA